MTEIDNIKIRCCYDKIVALSEIIPHPSNENIHTAKQIEVLSEMFKRDGIIHPIIISNLSGKIAAGHGRLLAAEQAGMESFPVDYQEFDDEYHELRVRNADNNIARYAEFSTNKMLDNLEGLDLDLEFLDFKEVGLIDFKVDDTISADEIDLGGDDLKSFISLLREEISRIVSNSGKDRLEAQSLVEAYLLDKIKLISWEQVECKSCL